MRLAACLFFSFAVAHADAPQSRLSTGEALHRLLAGNAAFVAGGASCARQTPSRRTDVAAAQHPIAVVVGCADSRVSPEALFGQGLGDLFVVRVAGNVIDDDIVGSVEYAVSHFGVPLVIVLGHSRCGAVEAALSPAPPPGHLVGLIGRIRLAVAGVRGHSGDALDNAIRANVAASVQKLQTAPPTLDSAIRRGRLRIVGARYDLDSGAVELLPDVVDP